jgi:dTDP-4-dehydrorhamnose reductase
MRLLITGAAGMLGLDVQAAAAAAGHEVTALPRVELDITDADAVAEAVAAARPEAVINCAAYTDVDGAEGDAATANAVNATAPGHLAAAAARAGAWTVHISTDYVFDGTKRTPYLESDQTAPLNQYGASKLAGERAVAAAAPGAHTIVRSSWLFGTGGACFPATMLRLAGERDELTVVDDQIGCPTFTGHLAPALLGLASAAQRPLGVVHLAGGGDCSWYEFAVAIFERAGADVSVHRGRTEDLNRPAPRPAYSVIRSERDDGVPPLPDWREGLRDYLHAAVTA